MGKSSRRKVSKRTALQKTKTTQKALAHSSNTKQFAQVILAALTIAGALGYAFELDRSQPAISANDLDYQNSLSFPFTVSDNGIFTLHGTSGTCKVFMPDVEALTLHNGTVSNVEENLITSRGSQPVDIALGEHINFLCDIKNTIFPQEHGYESPRGFHVILALKYQLWPFYLDLAPYSRTYSDTYNAIPDSQGQLHWVEGQ